ALTTSVALLAPAQGWADPGGGNVADGAVGTAQVGSTEVAPAATPAVENTAQAAVSAPTQVVGDGGNTAKDAVGTAQVGGGQSAKCAVASAPVRARRSL